MASTAQTTNNTEEDKYHELVNLVIDGKATLGDVKGFSEDELEAVYTVAYNFYNQNKQAEAEKLFQFLCLYSHLEAKYWMGFAACLQQQKKYQRAVEAYSFLAVLDVKNPHPPLYAAYCYLVMNDLEKAELGIESAVHWAGQKAEYADVIEKADTLKELLMKKRMRDEVDDNNSD